MDTTVSAGCRLYYLFQWLPTQTTHRARAAWPDCGSVTGAYDSTPAELLLAKPARPVDVIDALRAHLDGAELTVSGSKGQERTHPLLVSLQASQDLLRWLVTSLGLPAIEAEVVVPPTALEEMRQRQRLSVHSQCGLNGRHTPNAAPSKSSTTSPTPSATTTSTNGTSSRPELPRHRRRPPTMLGPHQPGQPRRPWRGQIIDGIHYIQNLQPHPYLGGPGQCVLPPRRPPLTTPRPPHLGKTTFRLLERASVFALLFPTNFLGNLAI